MVKGAEMIQNNQNVIVYIDGFNLYYGIKEKYGRKFYWLGIRTLALNLLKNNQLLVGIKYFTSRVRSSKYDQDKCKRQNTYIEALETLPDTRLFFGYFLMKEIVCGNCNEILSLPEEKMTDVNIANELLKDAFLNNFDVALLISADGDLVAPLDTVKNLFPEKRIVVTFPPSRFSADLAKRGPYLYISRRLLIKSQLPEKIIKPDGHVLTKPSLWS
jgi:uncharacterized LabA/DUF88 family protein